MMIPSARCILWLSEDELAQAAKAAGGKCQSGSGSGAGGSLNAVRRER